MTRLSEHEQKLVDRFHEGDESSFTEIYDRYWYKLFLSAYRRVRDKAVAEELVQNLFLKLWEKRDSVKINQLENYLFSSIRNATIDFLAKQMVANKYVEYYKVYAAMEANTTQDMVNMHDLESAMEKGLKELSGKSEKIFRLHEMNQWPVDKIARHLELSDKTVHYHLNKSLKFIRAYLREFTLIFVWLIS